MNIKQESPLKYSKPLIFSSVEIFPHKTSANSAESYPIPSHLYFANLAKYTEMSTSPMMNNSLCAVCEDVCSGKHYGVLSCNGCSGFFKRTVRRQLIYYCQNNSNMCIIDKAHRNQCQACRFKKCLQMGMIKEAVQNERQRRTTERAMSILHPDSSEQTNIISKIKQDEYTSVNHLNDSISTEILLMMIKWIRNIPIFLNLSIDDQFILLEESWSDLFLLWIIHYSMIFNNENQFFHSIKSINDISEVFKQFQVSPMEFDCLKTIVLFRTDIQRLKDIKTIENLQDQALITLAQLTYIHKPTRFGRLLLTLSLLRRIPSIFIEKTYFPHLIHHTFDIKITCKYVRK